MTSPYMTCETIDHGCRRQSLSDPNGKLSYMCHMDTLRSLGQDFSLSHRLWAYIILVCCDAWLRVLVICDIVFDNVSSKSNMTCWRKFGLRECSWCDLTALQNKAEKCHQPHWQGCTTVGTVVTVKQAWSLKQLIGKFQFVYIQTGSENRANETNKKPSKLVYWWKPMCSHASIRSLDQYFPFISSSLPSYDPHVGRGKVLQMCIQKWRYIRKLIKVLDRTMEAPPK